MASKEQRGTPEQQQSPRIQIYPTYSDCVSPFWKDKYERDAKRYWDIFYRRHQDKFFKDRHYLDKEWGHYFPEKGRKVLLEVGCGVGNTIFPLVASYPDLFVHACDFSARAVNLVKAHREFTDTRINAFVCDLTSDNLSQHIAPASVDLVTMVFVLSAVSPEKMPLVLQNLQKVLKPNGCVLFRDYATGDLAQERLTSKDQKISENFYVRGDGTRAYYFSEEYLKHLFGINGFDTAEIGVHCKQVENRSRELLMNRRWIQAVFRSSPTLNGSCIKPSNDATGDTEVDMSEGMALDMFGVTHSEDEVIVVNVDNLSFKIKLLSKEFQHTCRSTGLMLWESARLMTSILAKNPSILSGKRVLELGCGCTGICSMVAAGVADLVVASDGDEKTLNPLTENVASNLSQPTLSRLTIKQLQWGNQEQIAEIKKLNPRGFDIILGTDVTYVPEAISPLFATAQDLISWEGGNETDSCPQPALILCHVFRRVDEHSILSAASEFGFKLVDKWEGYSPSCSSQSKIASWVLNLGLDYALPTTALNILYFHKVNTPVPC